MERPKGQYHDMEGDDKSFYTVINFFSTELYDGVASISIKNCDVVENNFWPLFSVQ